MTDTLTLGGNVPHPLHISSRLMAAYTIDGVGTLHLEADGRNVEDRVRYHYVIEDVDGTVLADANDLWSGVGASADYLRTMVTLLSFLGDDAESYRADMDGPPLSEWAYLNDDALASARVDIDPDDNDN